MTNPICPYCGLESLLVKGDKIYPHRKDLYNLNFYYCNMDNAYVGCHKGTTKPLGRLANAELRKWKSEAHKVFDELWKGGYMSRSMAYANLAKEMNIDVEDCHIGMFNINQCKQAIEIAYKLYKLV